MVDAIGRAGTLVGGHVVEVDKGVVLDGIGIAVGQGAGGASDVLLVGLPGDAGSIEQGDQVAGGALMVAARRIIVGDPEVGARLEPEIVGQAGVDAGRVVVLLGVGG